MIGLLGAGLPLIAALLVAYRLDSRLRHALVTVPIALGLTCGLSSALFFALMLLPLPSRTALLAADTLVWIGIIGVLVALVLLRPHQKASNDTRPAPQPRLWFIAVAVMVLVVNASLALSRFVATTVVSPHGAWDAWAFWNAHARALFLGYPDVWRQGTLAILHPDYPLLTPVAIARTWQYLGHDTTTAPIALAACASTAIVILLAGAVRRTRGGVPGIVAAAALLGAPAFTAAAPSQFADIPIAFYFLAALVACDRAMVTGRLDWWIAAGASAGFAAWTKNEGQAFLLVTFAVAGILAWGVRAGGSARTPGFRAVLAFAIGTLPAVTVLALFRWALPFPHEVLSGLTIDRVHARLHNLARWRAIGAALGAQVWFGGSAVVGVLPIVAGFVAVRGVARPSPAIVRAAAAVLSIMLVLYAFVYLFSPYDLAWHLGTSADRVVVQLLPSTVYALVVWSSPATPDLPLPTGRA